VRYPPSLLLCPTPATVTRLLQHPRRVCNCVCRFVVVSRKRGRGAGTAEAGGALAAQAEPDDQIAGVAKKRKKSAQDMPNFYHFQQHERKREQLTKLRERFEQDKQRVARMRADRKFKPSGF
jgi:ribosomal RNA-processing protein 7